MLAEVRRTIGREKMLRPGEPLWVAVSGGVDSMVLLHVLRELGHPCSVAHVDHGLRGAESDADRDFVKACALREGLPFRSVRVDPKAVQGQSVQMAARGLRYAWFRELLREGPAVMALGHHRDDAVETLLLHLLRGVGLRGWEGIPPVTTVAEGSLCRPLLGVGRGQIMAYASKQGIAYREDASNADPTYLRNRVRSELLPLMETLRPGARRTLARSTELLRELGRLADRQLEVEAQGLVPAADGTLQIPLERLRQSAAPHLLLMRLLHHLGPHPDTLGQLLEAIIEGRTGAQFDLGGLQGTVTKETFSVAFPAGGLPSIRITMDLADAGAKGPFTWRACRPDQVDLSLGMNTAWLDMGRLQFPLILRPWCPGDRMRPVGLGGSKLISDILIDEGVPRNEKTGTYLLECGPDIVWLVGHRVAEGFSPRKASQAILRLEFHG